jgi:hypothetical protein
MINTMKKNNATRLIAIAVLVVGAAGAANAQSYQPEPLYPYVVQRHYYNAYPAPQYHTYPAPRTHAVRKTPRARAHALHAAPVKRASKVVRAQAEERHARAGRAERGLIKSRPTIVRGKPRVIVTRRVVDDPPRIIQRHYEVDDHNNVVSTDPPQPAQVYTPQQPAAVYSPPPRRHGAVDHQGAQLGPARVIHAEAEVTILGPDRMSIRLYRKGKGAEAAR